MPASARLPNLAALLVLCGAASACAASAPAQAPQTAASHAPSSPAREPPSLRGELPAPAHFPEEAREMLRARMLRHGEVMTWLMASVIFLGYEDAQQLAMAIVAEPKLGRAAPGEKDTLNALLPAPFFELQDQLAIRAGELAAAAERHDDAKLVASFGGLAETCVACHAAYLAEDLDAEDGELIGDALPSPH